MIVKHKKKSHRVTNAGGISSSHKHRIHILWFVGILVGFGIAACSKAPQPLLIAKVKDQPIYLNELELLGRLALANINLKIESDEGQKHYRKIAPNLYNTLIDLYVMKYAAEEAGIKPTDEELETEFKQIKETLMQENQYEAFLKGLGISEAKLKEAVHDKLAMNLFQNKQFQEIPSEISEEEIKNYYYSHHSQFCFPARMRASHIFFMAGKADGEEKRKIAYQKAEQIRQAVGDTPSQTFIGLAQKYSEDKATAPRGGDLGFFTLSGPELNEPFKKAAFNLPEGGVSSVVETDYGYHIIWSTDREESLEEAREEIIANIRSQKTAEYFAKWLEQAQKQMNVQRLFDPETFKPIEEKKKSG